MADLEFSHYKELFISKITTLEVDFKEFKKDMETKHATLSETTMKSHFEVLTLFNEFKNKSLGIVTFLSITIPIIISLIALFYR